MKILLDGIPQTLPDGQSQLTNVDFADLDRAEVLRGASSSLYGNASGGVISLQSRGRRAGAASRSGCGFRAATASGTRTASTSGRAGPRAGRGNASGTLSISPVQGRRLPAAQRRGDPTAQRRPRLRVLRHDPRHRAAEPGRQPEGAESRAPSPRAEYVANPDSAAANNIRRGADKDVQQQQLALGLRHVDAAGKRVSRSRSSGCCAIWRIRSRRRRRARSSRPPAPTSRIDRAVGGARASGTRRLGAGADGAAADRRAPTSSGCGTTGRTSCPSAGGPTDSVLLDQREKVTEFGPFAQLQWSPREQLAARARAPATTGSGSTWPTDHLSDGVDNSGQRTMTRPSGNVGASWSFGDQFVPYVNVSTSFETPTTTELVNQPDGSGGFNTELGPQRAVNYEVGARGQPTPRVEYSVALFLGRITRRDRAAAGGRRAGVLRQRGQDPQRRRGGRAHGDAGRRAHAERRLHLRPLPLRRLRGRPRHRRSTGNRLPGVPDHYWRFGLRGVPALRLLRSTPTTRSARRWRPTTLNTPTSWRSPGVRA